MSHYSPDGGVRTPTDSDRTVAILTHLSGPVAALVSVGWLGWLAPLVVWLVYRNSNPFVRGCAAGAFNFYVSLWVMNLVAWVCFFTFLLIPVALVLWTLGVVLLVWCSIRSVMAASRNEVYRYPFTLPLLS